MNAGRALVREPREDAFPSEAGIDPARQGAGALATTPAPDSDVKAPTLSARFNSKTKLRTVLRHGLLVRTRCSEACSLRLELTVARASVAGLKSAAPNVTVGRGRGSLGKAGTRVVRVRLSARSKRLLRRGRPHLLTLRVGATDRAGNRATARRGLRLRR